MGGGTCGCGAVGDRVAYGSGGSEGTLAVIAQREKNARDRRESLHRGAIGMVKRWGCPGA
jgi:hypothetical protein